MNNGKGREIAAFSIIHLSQTSASIKRFAIT